MNSSSDFRPVMNDLGLPSAVLVMVIGRAIVGTAEAIAIDSEKTICANRYSSTTAGPPVNCTHGGCQTSVLPQAGQP